MNEALDLALVLHLFLPPGLGDAERERAWAEVWRPILGAVHHNPSIRAGLVLGGDLLGDLEDHHPEALEWIRALLSRGQVELVATALYEPVLSGVPERDVIGQFGAHTTWLRKRFDVRPEGGWLPHAAWDPSVPRWFSEAGLSWTVVPDRFLEAIGEREGAVSGVYRTEREGLPLALLPYDTRVAEMGASVPVRFVHDHLRRRAEREQATITVALHADARGLHPGIPAARASAWLGALLKSLTADGDRTRTHLPSEAAKRGPSRGRVYLPAMAPEAIGVPWERHLVRHEETNRLHKRMLRVSRLAARLARDVRDPEAAHRPDPAALVQAQRYLYRAQDPAPYGVPGVYDPERRALAWRDLLRGERVALEALRAHDRTSIAAEDVDCDGEAELVLQTPEAVAIVDPNLGGGLVELSLYGEARNVVDVLTRTREPDHDELLELDEPMTEEVAEVTAGRILESELDEALDPVRRAVGFDPPPRAAFVERFLGPDTTLPELVRGDAIEVGQGFAHQVWQVLTAERHGEDALRALLTCDGTVRDPQGPRKVRLSKRYLLERSGVLHVKHEVLNKSHEVLRARLAVAVDLALGADARVVLGGEERAADAPPDDTDRDEVHLVGNLRAVLRFDRPARVWHHPVLTVFRAGDDWRVTCQGTRLWIVWAFELWGQEKWRVNLDLSFGSPP